jgi:hypothetical protein
MYWVGEEGSIAEEWFRATKIVTSQLRPASREVKMQVLLEAGAD